MWKTWMMTATLALCVAAPVRGLQEKPQDKEEEELTPEKALELLKEAHGLMIQTEDLLSDSSRGKALATEADIVQKLRKLLDEEGKSETPDLQKQILEKIERLMKKSEGSQKQTIERMGEIIRKAKQVAGKQGQPQPGQPQQQQQQQQAKPTQQPSNPAQAPYDPNRFGDPINKFRSNADRTGRWGDLPARVREKMLFGKRDVDDYPPEFQEQIKEFMKLLAGEKD